MGGVYGLLSLVLIGAFVRAGYKRRLFLTLLDRPDAPLPRFDFGRDLREGVPIVGIAICFWVPAVLLSLVPVAGMVVHVAMLLILPVALARYYTTGRFGAAFELDQVFHFIQANLSNMAISVAIALLAQIVAAAAGLLACLVGVAFTLFLSEVIATRALAEVWTIAREEQPTPPGQA
ncbi:MAG: DUF4013 domain-containing protein [Deltaproteobacteria bacterium]|nr:DUF4013 domain-containing protein [Deltaproteobacteria bacterium]